MKEWISVVENTWNYDAARSIKKLRNCKRCYESIWIGPKIPGYNTHSIFSQYRTINSAERSAQSAFD